MRRKLTQVWVQDDQKSTMGIYQIRCLVDGRVYVGSTVSFRKRWSEHKRTLNGYKHHCYLLQRAWNKYGIRNFTWEILEYVYNPGVLLEIEDEYIERLESAN
jgi:group I intron endonuclease